MAELGRPGFPANWHPLGFKLDWLAFADAWRAEYQPGMEEVRSGRLPFSKLDVLHRRNLVRFIPRFGLDPCPTTCSTTSTLAWHRLDAWPDVPAALKRLKGKFIIAPCSNGNIALMVDLARRNDLPWDAILDAEIAGDYKPKPRAYLAACEALDLEPGQCMMVAAHSRDLRRPPPTACAPAMSRGRTHRPGHRRTAPTVQVDVAGSDLADLADS